MSEPRSAFKAYKSAGIIKVRKTPKKQIFAATSASMLITPLKSKKQTNHSKSKSLNNKNLTKTPTKREDISKQNTSTPKNNAVKIVDDKDDTTVKDEVTEQVDITIDNDIDTENRSKDEIIGDILEVFKKKFSDQHKKTSNSKVITDEDTNKKENLKKKNKEKIPAKTTKVTKKTVNKSKKDVSAKILNMTESQINDDKILKFKVLKPKKTIKPRVKKSLKVVEQLSPIKLCSSIETGEEMFQWLIAPVTKSKFFDDYWEKSPLFVKRVNLRNYFETLLSMSAIDKMLKNNRVEFTKNIDITSYDKGERQTHNPEGRALPPIVWDYYNNGCSVRLLNPQTFIPQIHTLIATIQEYFQCMTGANVYLTPPNSQGFAPHYDDIEAFVIQIEGKKHWKLYKPRTPNEYLARTSSGNFKQDEIGEPFLDVVLESGDVLYFPRGTIHQACTVDDSHSLHLTLSVYQKNSWGDLMENIIPQTLSYAIENDIEFRRGLPMNLGQSMGLVYSDQPSEMREFVLNKVKHLFEKLINYVQIDDGVDRVTKRFQWDAMPPDITKQEKLHTVYGVSSNISNGTVNIPFEITDSTKIRLLRANILRMVREDDKIQIYSSVENSKEYHEMESVPLEIESVDAPAVEFLIRSYPDFAHVSMLPIDDPERRLVVINDLWEKGLLMTENPVE